MKSGKSQSLIVSSAILSASLAPDSLCAVRALLQAILQTEDMLKVYEARLTEEETVCLDLDKVEAYRCGLKVIRGVLTAAQFILEKMQEYSVPSDKALLCLHDFWGLLDFVGHMWLTSTVIPRTLLSRARWQDLPEKVICSEISLVKSN